MCDDSKQWRSVTAPLRSRLSNEPRASASGFIARVVLASVVLWLTGCQNQDQIRREYPMGERVPVGPLTYTVIESAWRTELGDAVQPRRPERRFLLITLSVTNSSKSEVSIPLLHLE